MLSENLLYILVIVRWHLFTLFTRTPLSFADLIKTHTMRGFTKSRHFILTIFRYMDSGVPWAKKRIIKGIWLTKKLQQKTEGEYG